MAGLTKIETLKRRNDRLSSTSSRDSGFFLNELHFGESSSSVRSNKSGSSAYSSAGSDLTAFDLMDVEPSRVSKHEILAEIHYAVCQLYCQERIPFSNDASAFHLKLAAKMGHQEAMSLLSKKLLGLPTDILEEIEIDSDLNAGWSLLDKVAQKGDCYAQFLVARALQTGVGLPDNVVRDWAKADALYSTLIEQGDEFGTPLYTLLQYRAEMAMTGGHNVEPDPQTAAELFEEAAEDATNQMRGKQAAKFFEMAEAAWALVE